MDLNFLEIKAKPPSIIEWSPARSYILIGILLVVGSVGGIIKGLFLHFIWNHAPPNRPINSIIFREQVNVQINYLSVIAFQMMTIKFRKLQ